MQTTQEVADALKQRHRQVVGAAPPVHGIEEGPDGEDPQAVLLGLGRLLGLNVIAEVLVVEARLSVHAELAAAQDGVQDV